MPPHLRHAYSAKSCLHRPDRDSLVSQEEVFIVRELPIAVPFQSRKPALEKTIDWLALMLWKKKLVIHVTG